MLLRNQFNASDFPAEFVECFCDIREIVGCRRNGNHFTVFRPIEMLPKTNPIIQIVQQSPC